MTYRMSSLLYSLPLTSNWLQQGEVKDQSELPDCLQALKEETSPLLLLGDGNCGKTLLLFQAAVSYASQDHHVTFISRRPLSQMPLPVHGMTRPETAGLLKTLTFLYMSSVEEVVKYCSSIHTRTLLPDVLIVDDVEYYLNQLTEPSSELGCAKFCAILLDAMKFVRQKSEHGYLMLGCRSKQTFIPTIFTQFGYNIANISYVAKETQHNTMSLKTRSLSLHLEYCIQTLGLFLKHINICIPNT